jgi:hypothetical protein
MVVGELMLKEFPGTFAVKLYFAYVVSYPQIAASFEASSSIAPFVN